MKQRFRPDFHPEPIMIDQFLNGEIQPDARDANLTTHLLECQECFAYVYRGNRVAAAVLTLMSDESCQATPSSWIAKNGEPVKTLTVVLPESPWTIRLFGEGPRSGRPVKSNRLAEKDSPGAVAKPANALSRATVREFAEADWADEVLWALSYAARKSYASILKCYVLPVLGELPIASIRSDQLHEIIRKRVEAGYSVQTAMHMRTICRSLFEHARKKGAFFGVNPTFGLKIPKLKPVRARNALTVEQARTVLAHLRSPTRELALLSITTGMSVSEMTGLRWQCVNLTDKPVQLDERVLPPCSLLVRETCVEGHYGGPKNGKRRRILPLSNPLLNTLTELKGTTRFGMPTDPVFASRNGTPFHHENLNYRDLAPLAKKLGLPSLGFNVFRRTHASLTEELGMALSDRQAQLGHSNSYMTQHYTVSNLDRRRKELERLARTVVKRPAKAG